MKDLIVKKTIKPELKKVLVRTIRTDERFTKKGHDGTEEGIHEFSKSVKQYREDKQYNRQIPLMTFLSLNDCGFNNILIEGEAQKTALEDGCASAIVYDVTQDDLGHFYFREEK